MKNNLLVLFLVLFFAYSSPNSNIYSDDNKLDNTIVIAFVPNTLEISDKDMNSKLNKLDKFKKYNIHSCACTSDKGTLIDRFTMAKKRVEKIKALLLDRGFINENLTTIVSDERGFCSTIITEKDWKPKIKIELENINNNLRVYLFNEGEEVLINSRFTSFKRYPSFPPMVQFEIVDKEGKKFPFGRGLILDETFFDEKEIVLLTRSNIIGHEFNNKYLGLLHALPPGKYKARVTYENTRWADKGVYIGRLTSNWVSFEVPVYSKPQGTSIKNSIRQDQ